MPRYYFHLTDGKQVLNNHKGVDLSGNAAARKDALALTRDLKHGAVMPGWNWTGWFVAIVDQHGQGLNFCHRLGSTIFPFRRRPLSPVVVPRWPEQEGADFLILGLSYRDG
jgi:hypothetical protein